MYNINHVSKIAIVIHKYMFPLNMIKNAVQL